MAAAEDAKRFVIQIYETLYEQEKRLQNVEKGLLALLGTVRELHAQADVTYAKHCRAEAEGPQAEQYAELLNDISEIIRQLKASLPN